VPFFSVILTTFNRENLIERAINSLLKQIEPDWELIISDDGSTDGTSEKIKYYINNYPNIIYTNHENSGPGFSKNQGIALAHGKFITFLDSDDAYKPTHLSLRKQILEANNLIDFLHGGAEIIGNPFVPDFNDNSKLIHLENCVIGGTFFIKKDAINLIVGFPENRFGDDTEFFAKAEKAGLKIVKTDIKTYVYHRDNPDSICNQKIGTVVSIQKPVVSIQ
jgi:glycosyltransferase involved in cell wall biosynthesis